MPETSEPTFPLAFDLFDNLTGEMAIWSTETEFDASALVLTTYGDAVKALNANAYDIIEFLDKLDDTFINGLAKPADRDRAQRYLDNRGVFDKLFLPTITIKPA